MTLREVGHEGHETQVEMGFLEMGIRFHTGRS